MIIYEGTPTGARRRGQEGPAGACVVRQGFAQKEKIKIMRQVWSLPRPGCPGAEFAKQGKGKLKTCLKVLGLLRGKPTNPAGFATSGLDGVRRENGKDKTCLKHVLGIGAPQG